MRARTRPTLVPRPPSADKRVVATVALALCAAMVGACSGGGVSTERHERMHSIALLDAAERGHFLRPDPVVSRRRVSERRRPAGPATAAPYRKPRSSGLRYAPQRHGGAATRSSGSSGQRASQRIEAARAFLGTAGLKGQPFVAQVLRTAGQAIDLPGDRPYASTLHSYLKQRGNLSARADVKPGDLVFFANTLDLNGNSRPDDGITFVALVEEVSPGRVIFIGQRAGKVRRMALHLDSPNAVRDSGGQVINTRLVRWPGDDKALTAARCFATWARP